MKFALYFPRITRSHVGKAIISLIRKGGEIDADFCYFGRVLDSVTVMEEDDDIPYSLSAMLIFLALTT